VEPDPAPSPAALADSSANKAATEFRATASAGGGAAIGGGDGGKMKVMVREDGGKPTVSNGPSIHLDRKMTMASLADLLGRMVDKPVVDMTEKKGFYQIALDLPIQALMQAKGATVVVNGVPGGDMHGLGGDTASDPSGSAIFGSIQQLGLKLDPRKAQMDVLVIDRAEKVPTEN
jgi:uncharacterized protein (TIGR03435 family)